MNIKDLAALVEVIDRGSLSAAAAELGVTTSAISRRISRLERELEAQLLHRTTLTTEPTEAGRRVLEHARTVIESVQLAKDAAVAAQTDVRGLVRVISLMAFGRLHVTPLIEEIRRRHPRVQLDLIFDDRRERILDRDFDIALVAGMPRSDSFFVTRIVDLGSVVCASPEYIDSHGAPHRPQDLRAHDCILYSYSGAPDTWVFRRRGRTTEVQVAGTTRANNGEVVAELVSRGLGIGRVPDFIASPHLSSGEMVNLFPGFEMATVPLIAVTQQGRHLPQRVRAVLNILLSELRLARWATSEPANVPRSS